MKDYYTTNFLRFILINLIALMSANVSADANPDIWPFLKEQVFKERAITEDQSS